MIKDLLIIGCGPAGLYAWKMAQNFNLTGDVVESKATYGGQVTNLYPSKEIFNLPAIKSITGKEAMDEMYNSLNHEYKAIECHFNTSVLDIKITFNKELENNTFEVLFSNNLKYVYKTILFTDGMGLLLPIKLIDKDFDNVLYKYTNNNIFKGKNVVIFGGGDSAIDCSNELAPISNSVKLVHRRDEFRGMKSGLSNAVKSNVDVMTPYVFDKIINEKNNKIEKIALKNVLDSSTINVDLDYAVVHYGFKNQNLNFKNLEVLKNDLGKMVVDNKMQTSIKGIFASGDCCDYEGKIKNLVSCVYESLVAIVNIDKIINNKNLLNKGW
ncbi:thioredoxin reductase [Spiroplasma litorale]|uniref:Ferredoxin--NADP reductase n=1 Tax=Spiroplasma litorale TaxID=216942 RepID=A0A0K1W2Z2_9MOLU|nr:NAD(P)/FAD-dependent oxidoreductase [Spiroplasma litorale]AKX34546.1 thioredoxin reductase [Spiroplasma litorale]